MKVLKSGVEMTPKELENTKGASCACGCDFSGYELNATADVHGSCYCNCFGKLNPERPSGFMGGGFTARDYN